MDGDKIDGSPEQMRAFLQLQREIPDLNTVPTVTPGPTCATGTMGCSDLSAAESAATRLLLRYLTHMTQGIAGYVEIMRKTSQIYADGATSTVADIRAAVANIPAAGLPDLAPDLATPEFTPREA
jgi:hypothetical protein